VSGIQIKVQVGLARSDWLEISAIIMPTTGVKRVAMGAGL
jgi:hypothetical protein